MIADKIKKKKSSLIINRSVRFIALHFGPKLKSVKEKIEYQEYAPNCNFFFTTYFVYAGIRQLNLEITSLFIKYLFRYSSNDLHRPIFPKQQLSVNWLLSEAYYIPTGWGLLFIWKPRLGASTPRPPCATRTDGFPRAVGGPLTWLKWIELIVRPHLFNIPGSFRYRLGGWICFISVTKYS